jgi:histidinol-phosphatase (PHP family)
MSLPADYHMHTPLCQHATGQPVEYAARALKTGLVEIGFSDHAPMRQDDFDNWRMRFDQLEEYVLMVRHAQTEFPQLSVKLGLEIDYLPGYEDWIRELSTQQPWDYLIGSVHYVWDGWDIDNPAKKSEWKKWKPLEVWTAYYERLTQAADSGLFDIIGHADLPKKFCFYPEQDVTYLYQRFLAAAQRRQVAVEINTAGLRKECREVYPNRRLLELAAQNGVAITFGSDAHAPTEVGMDFSEAVQLAQSVGYRQFCRFTGRTRASSPL